MSKENQGGQFKAPRYIKSQLERRRWEDSARRVYVLKHGEGTMRVADPNGNGDTYIDREPGFICPTCKAGFHSNAMVSQHHEMIHPELRNPHNDPPE